MFSVFVSKFGEIVAPTEGCDNDSNGSSATEDCYPKRDDKQLMELTPVTMSSISSTPYLEVDPLERVESRLVKTGSMESGVLSESSSSHNSLGGRLKTRRKFSWASVGSASSDTRSINTDHLFSLTSAAGICSNPTGAEVPIENLLSNCNQLLNTVEYSLRHDRFFAQSLSEELASSKYMNERLLAQGTFLEDSQRDRDVIIKENEEMKRQHPSAIAALKNEIIQIKSESAEHLLAVQKQLSSQKLRAEDEETNRTKAWRDELKRSKTEANDRLESLQQQLKDSQQQNLGVELEESKRIEAWKDELKRTKIEASEQLNSLQQQLNESLSKCILAEEMNKKITDEKEMIMEQHKISSEEMVKNKKICEKIMGRYSLLRNVLSSPTGNKMEIVLDKSGPRTHQKFERYSIEELEKKIFQIMKNNEEKSFQDVDKIRVLEGENKLSSDNLQTLRSSIHSSVPIIQNEKSPEVVPNIIPPPVSVSIPVSDKFTETEHEKNKEFVMKLKEKFDNENDVEREEERELLISQINALKNLLREECEKNILLEKNEKNLLLGISKKHLLRLSVIVKMSNGVSEEEGVVEGEGEVEGVVHDEHENCEIESESKLESMVKNEQNGVDEDDIRILRSEIYSLKDEIIALNMKENNNQILLAEMKEIKNLNEVKEINETKVLIEFKELKEKLNQEICTKDRLLNNLTIEKSTFTQCLKDKNDATNKLREEYKNLETLLEGSNTKLTVFINERMNEKMKRKMDEKIKADETIIDEAIMKIKKLSEINDINMDNKSNRNNGNSSNNNHDKNDDKINENLDNRLINDSELNINQELSLLRKDCNFYHDQLKICQNTIYEYNEQIQQINRELSYYKQKEEKEEKIRKEKEDNDDKENIEITTENRRIINEQIFEEFKKENYSENSDDLDVESVNLPFLNMKMVLKHRPHLFSQFHVILDEKMKFSEEQIVLLKDKLERSEYNSNKLRQIVRQMEISPLTCDTSLGGYHPCQPVGPSFVDLLEASERRNEEEIIRRKSAEAELTEERTRMQYLLDSIVLPSSPLDDQVDKVLITNLFVAYFHTKKQLDVLNLIAKVLSFSDEQLTIVGLKNPPQSLLSALFSSMIPVTPDGLKGESLGELWLNFLLQASNEPDETEPSSPLWGKGVGLIKDLGVGVSEERGERGERELLLSVDENRGEGESEGEEGEGKDENKGENKSLKKDKEDKESLSKRDEEGEESMEGDSPIRPRRSITIDNSSMMKNGSGSGTGTGTGSFGAGIRGGSSVSVSGAGSRRCSGAGSSNGDNVCKLNSLDRGINIDKMMSTESLVDNNDNSNNSIDDCNKENHSNCYDDKNISNSVSIDTIEIIYDESGCKVNEMNINVDQKHLNNAYSHVNNKHSNFI